RYVLMRFAPVDTNEAPPGTLPPVRIGILGGTGPAGSALAARLASVGYEVVLGSRSKYRAMEAVDQLLEQWDGRELATFDAEAELDQPAAMRGLAIAAGDNA